ncbi:MAG: hypothetical protein Q9205_006293 [Flavoplaca limonia]
MTPDMKFLSPDATAKTEVPGIRALRQTRSSTAITSEIPADGITGAIKSFFGAAGSDGTKGQLLNGFENFQKTISTALSVFLGNASAGQKDETKYFVYMHHNAIVRVDVKASAILTKASWAVSISKQTPFEFSTSTLAKYDADIICLSVVDIAVLKTAEFVYLISEYAGDSETEVAQYCEAMGKMYSAARMLKQSQAIASPSD